jgi:hypothetical protein
MKENRKRTAEEPDPVGATPHGLRIPAEPVAI